MNAGAIINLVTLLIEEWRKKNGLPHCCVDFYITVDTGGRITRENTGFTLRASMCLQDRRLVPENTEG